MRRKDCLARLVPRLISFARLAISSLLMFVLFCFLQFFFLSTTLPPPPPPAARRPATLSSVRRLAASGEHLPGPGRSISGSHVQQTRNVDEMRSEAEQWSFHARPRALTPTRPTRLCAERPSSVEAGDPTFFWNQRRIFLCFFQELTLHPFARAFFFFSLPHTSPSC